MRRRVVVILATAVAAFAAAWILLRDHEAPDATEFAAGEREGERAPRPALAAPGAGEAGRRAAGGHLGDPLGAPGVADEEEPPDVWVPFRLVTTDAATGLAVASAWNLGTGEVVAAPFAPGQVVDEAAIRAQEEGVRRSVAEWEAQFLPSGETKAEAFSIWSFDREFPITVRPPTDYVPPDRRLDVTGPLAAGVREAMAVVPVHREAPLLVRVLGPDGRPAVGATIAAVEAAGRRLDDATEVSGPGAFRVRRIPHMVGEPVHLFVAWSDGDSPGDVPPIEVKELEEILAPTAESVVPEDLSRPWTVDVVLLAPTAPCLLDTIEVDFGRPFEEDLAPETEGPAGSARVVVLGWDGTPVREASVFGQPTDRDGVVLLTGLPPGEIRFRTAPVGRFPAVSVALVREGRPIDVVLREPLGATLDVVVTDEDGAPRPSAFLTITGARVFDVVDGVQRLDRFTDARGRRTFARVEPGEVTVEASWGSRRGSGTVTLRDGARTTLRVVAR